MRQRLVALKAAIPTLLLAAALVVAVFVAYQPAWHGTLLWDDDAHVTSPELQSWQGLYRIWFELDATQQYYPLLHSVFWLEHKLWGDSVLGHHLTNIFLHAMAAIMVAYLLRRLKVPGAYLAAAIFALHPVQVESVAWITELKNTLSAVFYLGAAIVYVRFDETRKWRWYLVAILLFAFGLMSKTVTATLPAALLVVFWWQRGRLSWRRDVLPLLPFFALGAAAGLFTAWVERTLIGAQGDAFELSIVERFMLAGRVLWFYLGKLVGPADLIFIYPRWQMSQAAAWQYLFSAAALVCLAVLWALRRKWRGPLAGVLFFAGTLFPVLGFCNVYPFIYSFVADHFQYLASLGIIALASAGAVLLLARYGLWGRATGNLLCLALLATLAVLTWRQSRMYSDVLTLYEETIERNPDCWMAYNNLGIYWSSHGKLDDAIAYYEKALDRNPECATVHVNLGASYGSQNKWAEAMAHYQRAAELRPDYPEAHFNIGAALQDAGKVDEAIASYERVLQIKPKYARAHNNLGTAYAKRGQLDKAIFHFEQAIQAKPDSADAYDRLGTALYQKGDVEKAIAMHRKAVELKPNDAQFQCDLGEILQEREKVDEATACFQQAIEADPKYARAYLDLGQVFYRQGKLSEALVQYEKAIEHNAKSGQARGRAGIVLARQGKLAEAVNQLQKALEIEPEYAEGHVNLGAILVQQQKIDEAIAHLEKALQIKPDLVQARQNLDMIRAERERMLRAEQETALRALAKQRAALRVQPDSISALNDTAWTLATSPYDGVRNGAEAVTLAERAAELAGGKDPAVLDTLAAAYAEAGRFPDAVQTAQKALDLATSQNKAPLVNTLRSRIKLYESNTPYHAQRPAPK